MIGAGRVAGGRRARGGAARREAFGAAPSRRFGESRRPHRDGSRPRLPGGRCHRAGGLRQVDACWLSGPRRRIDASGGCRWTAWTTIPSALLSVLASAYARISGHTDLIADMRGSWRIGVGPGRAAPGLGVPDQPGSVRADARRPARAPVPGLSRCAERGDLGDTPRVRNWWRRVVPSSLTCRGCGPRVMRWSSRPATWPSTRRAPSRSSREAHVDITPELAAAVTARTEGWPVGLYLAAVIARDSRRRRVDDLW